MKKLFFLCTFLFMSVQIKAQLYIVTVEMTSVISDCVGISAPCAHITIIGPENVTEQVIVGFDVDQANADDFAQHYIELHSILNEIISNGYELVYVKEFSAEINYNNSSAAYFLAIP